MTLEEFKIKVLSMIEEYDEGEENLTQDEDIAAKLNSVINQVQNELARFKKIDAYKQMDVTEGQAINLTDIDMNIYQLNVIKGIPFDPIGGKIIFGATGTADIYYYKYPKQINADTDDDYKFELDRDVIEIMVYGVAADLLKSDVASNYGQVYANRYKELVQTLDPRKGMQVMYFDTSESIDYL